MIDKPVAFCLINLIAFFGVMTLFGFESSFPLSVIFSILIITYHHKKIGWEDSLVLGIIYLLAFDSTVFYFSAANIRVWYFYLIIIYIIKFLKGKRFLNFNKNILEYICVFFFLIVSIYYLFVEDFISDVNNLKYWIFYVGLILILNDFFKRNVQKHLPIINYIISITTFIMFWGLIQFGTNLMFISNYQLDYFNIRPSGFFSETTWYSEFCFFGLVLIFLVVTMDKRRGKLLFLFPFYFVGFIFSVTRNTFLALFLYVVLSFILALIIEKKIYLNVIKSKIFQLIGSAVVLVIGYLLFNLGEVAAFFTGKFDGQDGSAQGRLEAYKISIDKILNSDLIGNGFFWDFSQSTSSGSALGAKSFNLFLMMGHIFGLFGLFVFMILLGTYLSKNLYYYKALKSTYFRYSIIIILLFVQMSMFAPLHQFPFGMLIVSISVFLYNIGIYEKNSLCHPSI